MGNVVYKMSEKNVTEISFDGENPYEKIYEAYKLTDAFVYSAGELFHLPETRCEVIYQEMGITLLITILVLPLLLP